MEVFVILSFLAVILTAAYFKFKTMRKVDAASLIFNVMSKMGILTFLEKTGLNKKMRSKLTPIEGPNGFKTLVPDPLFTFGLEQIRTLKIRDDDVFLATYAKAGTTWMQEITWLICNNADIDGAKSEPVTSRSPFLELVDLGKGIKGIQSIETWPKNKRRLIKTHLAYELLPEEILQGGKCKMICVARNPKDLCVSYYFFHVMNYRLPEPGTWSEFLTNFCSGNVGGGSWFDHTLKYWEEYKKNKDQIYFTTYEALKKDLRSELIRIAKYLEKELTDDQLDKIAKHCTFKSMSENKTANQSEVKPFGMDFKKSKFMRKGQVGDWKNYFTLNENAAFDEMYEERMKDSGLHIPFEL